MAKSPTTDEQSRKQLLARAVEGDTKAFWKLVRPCERTIHAVAYGVTGDPEMTRDIAHDTFVRAFSTLGNLRSESRLSSWLYSMARNIAHEHLRKAERGRRALANQPAPEVISVPEMLVEKERLRQLEEALHSLPEPHRVVLGLKYMNNMSCREIADALDIGLEAAKSRLFEARKVLRARMEAADRTAATDPAQHTRGVQKGNGG
ncbi:RNA polymerase sigma factor [bacterium]|nr:RNA polymerase sigma factor [bacterium]